MKGNILVILQSLNPRYGGIESVGTQISCELRKHGYKVFCAYLYDEKNDLKNSENFDGVLKIDVWQRNHDIDKLLEFIENNKIVVVINHFHVIRLSWPIQKSVTDHSAVKWINTVHIDPKSYSRVKDFNNSHVGNGLLGQLSYFIYNQFIRFLRRRAYRHSDATILLAESFMDSYQAYLGVGRNVKLYYINNPLREFALKVDIAKKENLIINVGRLQILQKRTDKVLKFWSKFWINKTPNAFRLEIVGDGEDAQKLHEMSRSLNLSNCMFSGHTNNPESYYNRAKILLMTSDYEGWPLVLVEAMSYGCVPIVMNNFGSLREIIDDGVNGIIVDNDDYDAMIDGVEKIVNDFDRFSQEAIKKSHKFKVGNIIGQWIDLLENI